MESLSDVGGKKRAQSDVVASTAAAVGIGTDCCEIDHIITSHAGRHRPLQTHELHRNQVLILFLFLHTAGCHFFQILLVERLATWEAHRTEWDYELREGEEKGGPCSSLLPSLFLPFV